MGKTKGKSPLPPTIAVDTAVRRFSIAHSNPKKHGKDIILYTLDGTVPEASVHGFPEVGRRPGADGKTKIIDGVGNGRSLAVVCTAIAVRNNGTANVVVSRPTVVTAHIRTCPLPQAILSNNCMALGIDDQEWEQVLRHQVDHQFQHRKHRQSMLVDHTIEYYVVNAGETYGASDDYYVTKPNRSRAGGHAHADVDAEAPGFDIFDGEDDDEDENDAHPSWDVPPAKDWTAYDGGMLTVDGPIVCYARTSPSAAAGPWWVPSRILRQPVVHCAVPTMTRDSGLVHIALDIDNTHTETGRMKVLPSMGGMLEYTWGTAAAADAAKSIWTRLPVGVTTATVEMPTGMVSQILTLTARFTMPSMLPSVSEGYFDIMKCAEPSIIVNGADVELTMFEAGAVVHYTWGSEDDGTNPCATPGEPGTAEWVPGEPIPIDTAQPGMRFLALLLTKPGMQQTATVAAFDVEALGPPRLVRDGGRIEVLLPPKQNLLAPLDPSWLGDGFGGDFDEDDYDGGGTFDFDAGNASVWSVGSAAESFAGFGSAVGDYSSEGGESYAGFERIGDSSRDGASSSAARPATFPVLVAPFSVATNFASLDTNHPDVSELPGTLAELTHANRYRNILPNKHSAVLLDAVEGTPFSSYINANLVRGFDAMPGNYVATQGPLPSTIADFWRMVWVKKSDAIVMVTGLVENGRTKCGRYWPADLVPPDADVAGNPDGAGTMQAGNFKIAAISATRIGAYMKTSLRVSLTNASTGEVEGTRAVSHFWYDTWPDHGVPGNTTGVTEMLAAVRLHSAGGPDAPWIVHCSAGIGRTGTFIGIDMGMQHLQESGTADVTSLIQQMRGDRGGMVQSGAQAAFIHTALEQFATSFNATAAEARTEMGSDGNNGSNSNHGNEGNEAGAGEEETIAMPALTTLDAFAESLVQRSIADAVESVMNVFLGISNDDDDDDVEYRRYARIDPAEASAFSIAYAWAASSDSNGAPPSCFWNPLVESGAGEGGGAPLSQQAPWIPMYCKLPGYQTLEITLQKVGFSPIVMRQAFNVLPAALPALVRDGDVIVATVAGGVELQLSWDKPLEMPETGYVPGMERKPLPDHVQKIPANLAAETVVKIPLDCSVAGTLTLHMLAVRPGFSSSPLAIDYEVVDVDEPTFTRDSENIRPTLKSDGPSVPHLYTAFGAPPKEGSETAWSGNGPISLEDAVNMYLARGTTDAKATRMHWLVTETGKAPRRGVQVYELIRVELPKIARKADKFGPGKLIYAGALDKSKCRSLFFAWGNRSPAPSADFAWPGEFSSDPLQLDCSTGGKKQLQVLGTHPNLLPAKTTISCQVDQLPAPRAAFAVIQADPMAAQSATPNELEFQTKLLSPPGSVYSASDIFYTISKPATAMNSDAVGAPESSIVQAAEEEKAEDKAGEKEKENGDEGKVSGEDDAENSAEQRMLEYKTPFAVSAKGSIRVQAMRNGYAPSTPTTYAPPTTGRVDPPQMTLIEGGPDGVAVRIQPITARAQIMVSKSWSGGSSGAAGAARLGRKVWAPLSGQEGPDGFLVPVDCSEPGPHTVSAFGRKVGLGDSNPVTSITVQIERAPTPIMEIADAGFCCTAPADSIVRYCYGVSNTDGAPCGMEALELTSDPYRWSTMRMHDASVGVVGNGNAKHEFMFEGQLEPLRELERKGDEH